MLMGYERVHRPESKGPTDRPRACFVRGLVARPEGIGRARTTALRLGWHEEPKQLSRPRQALQLVNAGVL